MIMDTLKQCNKSVWVQKALSLSMSDLQDKRFDSCEQRLRELKVSCFTQQALASGNSEDSLMESFQAYDMSKGSQLLEVFSIEIQMCIARGYIRRMKRVYTLAQRFSSTIEDPRVVAIIKECGGKMYMSEKKWQQALEEFQASLKCYVDCGSTTAKNILKYVIWTAMLAKTEFDVQGTQEAKIYKDDDLIVGMTKLGEGFANNDL